MNILHSLKFLLVATLLTCFAQQAVQAQAPQGAPLKGTVIETMNSGGYTYARLKKDDGSEQWVAMPETTVTTGQALTVLPGAEMQNFESKTLKRKFDSIIFSGGVADAGAAAAPSGMPAHPAVPKPAAEKIEVEKAAGPNGYRVAEIFADPALDQKTVAVRGKAVKVLRGIMGKTWIHLQDGTGEAEKATHDLVVTSQDAPEVGTVVTMEGRVARDKDFGSGYRYAVIVEDAVVKK